MSNVTYLPSANGAPVVQAKRRGRLPASVPSVWRARLDRYIDEQNAHAPAKIRPVPPPKRRKGKFAYPASMLLQAYFCLGGNGVWQQPCLDLGMLTDEKFISPMGALLDQLESEGHDVGGARAEWMAFRELSSSLRTSTKQLVELGYELQQRRPVLASYFLSDKGIK